MTKFEKYAAIFIVVGLLALLVVACCKVSRHRGYKAGYADALASAVTDTVWHTDTIKVDKPVPVEVVKWKDKPVLVPVDSLVYVHDTAYVELPWEAKIYQDSTYRCEVSGVQPQLDWIDVYQRTQTITNTVVVPSPRFSIGVGLGPGVVWNQNGLHAGVGIVAGVQYRF